MALTFATHDIVPDSPTNNFCTLNPLESTFVNSSNILAPLSNGNLIATANRDVSPEQKLGFGNIGSSSGKWYWEIVTLTKSGTSAWGCGILSLDINEVYYYYAYTGNKLTNSSNSSYGATYDVGDVIGVYWDADAGTLTFFKNNISQGTAFSGLSGTYIPYSSAAGGSQYTVAHNFGQDPTFGGNKSPTTTYTDANEIGSFYYDPTAIDSEALSLCTANLPDFTPTVTGDVPQDYFKAVLYTGQTNSSTYNNGDVTVGFQPDLVWIKNRDQADGHRLFTSSTGVHNYFQTDDRSTGTSTTSLTSFNSTGFSIGTDVTVNTFGENYVGWCWAAGSSETNNDGTIQSTIRRNVNSGISIVQYTGNGSASATVGHGLSTVDGFFCINNSSGLVFFPNILGLPNMYIHTDAKALNDAGSNGSYGNFTSSTFGFRNGSSNNVNNVNTNGTTYTVLVFQNVENFSKIGSYTGNGSADGPFVYCGFRPAFVMIKNSSIPSQWAIYDSVRETENVMGDKILEANQAGVEVGNSNYHLDFLSNGFKVRTLDGQTSGTNNTIIFMAFSEQPFKYANAR
jgi:hypothetical protein